MPPPSARTSSVHQGAGGALPSTPAKVLRASVATPSKLSAASPSKFLGLFPEDEASSSCPVASKVPVDALAARSQEAKSRLIEVCGVVLRGVVVAA